MKISYDPNNYTPVGICSFTSWDNQELRDALRVVFGESPREAIKEIIIRRDGLTAIFETRPEAIRRKLEE